MKAPHTEIRIPAGTTAFEIPGPDGIYKSDTVVTFEATPDEVAAGLAAAGHTSLLPLLQHKDGAKIVSYNATGARVEQTHAEAVAAGHIAKSTKAKPKAKAKPPKKVKAAKPRKAKPAKPAKAEAPKEPADTASVTTDAAKKD